MDLSPEHYCRQLEAYLCRKNDGHLVRIVGPSFEQVCGWAERGVPLKVAQRGIDRYFARYYAKGPRRRPVRIEFCEADVLDIFDEWRRAVGVPARGGDAAGAAEAADSGEDDHSGRRTSLPAHLERVIARLTAARAGDDRSMDPVIDAIVRELDAARATARALRGEARGALVERLRALDAAMIAAARERCAPSTLEELAVEAAEELAPFRDRMPSDAYEQSRAACIGRGLRERLRLPMVAYEP